MIKSMKKIFFTIIGLIICIPLALAVQTGLTGQEQHEFLDYQRHHDVTASAASLGPSAPGTVVQDTTICLGYDMDAEKSGLIFEIPPEWNGTSDMGLNIDWYPEAGDVLQNGETVIWLISYYSIADNEAIDNGTIVNTSVTYTQSGAGTDKEAIESQILIDYDNANQPLAAEDDILILFSRDVTSDTYSGDGVVCKWELEYTANKLATH